MFPQCPYHGAEEDLVNELESSYSPWFVEKKIHVSPWRKECLAKSFVERKTIPVYKPMKQELEWFYNASRKLTTTAYVREAFKHIVMIHHQSRSNQCLSLQLGCLCCKRLTSELYYRDTLQEQEIACEVFSQFFRPYRLEQRTHWMEVYRNLEQTRPGWSSRELPHDLNWEGWYHIADPMPLPRALLSDRAPYRPEPTTPEAPMPAEDEEMSNATQSNAPPETATAVPLTATEPDVPEEEWDCWWQRRRNQRSVQWWNHNSESWWW